MRSPRWRSGSVRPSNPACGCSDKLACQSAKRHCNHATHVFSGACHKRIQRLFFGTGPVDPAFPSASVATCRLGWPGVFIGAGEIMRAKESSPARPAARYGQQWGAEGLAADHAMPCLVSRPYLALPDQQTMHCLVWSADHAMPCLVSQLIHALPGQLTMPCLVSRV